MIFTSFIGSVKSLEESGTVEVFLRFPGGFSDRITDPLDEVATISVSSLLHLEQLFRFVDFNRWAGRWRRHSAIVGSKGMFDLKFHQLRMHEVVSSRRVPAEATGNVAGQTWGEMNVSRRELQYSRFIQPTIPLLMPTEVVDLVAAFASSGTYDLG